MTPQLDTTDLLALAVHCHALGIKRTTLPDMLPDVEARAVKIGRATVIRLRDRQTRKPVASYRVTTSGR